MKSWLRLFLFAGLLTVLCGIGLGLGRLTTVGTGDIDPVRRAVEQATGTRIAMTGLVATRIFPRPEITATGLTIGDPSGAILADIPSVRASLSIGQLLLGRAVVETIQVIGPTGTLDLDALASRWREAAALPAAPPADQAVLPSRLVVQSGVLHVRSAARAIDALVTDLRVNASGSLDRATSVSGRAEWRGQQADWQVRLDTPRSFLAGESTPASLKIRTQDGVLSAEGTLPAGWRGRFNGGVAVTTGSLPALLRLAGLEAEGLSLSHASFYGVAAIDDDGVAFENAKLTLDKTAFEGTLAWQREQDHRGVFGTLATGSLDFDALMPDELPRFSDLAALGNRLIVPSKFPDFDLRISANRAKIAGFEATDAAFSLLNRAGRVELSLGEAHAYGGMVKARLLATRAGGGIDAKAEASVAGVALGEMTTALRLKPDDLSGFATGHLTIEGQGPDLDALLASAKGQGQISIRQGAIGLAPAMRAILQPDHSPTPDEPAAATAFDLASSTLRVEDGRLTVLDGLVSGPQGRTAFRGTASLTDGSFAVTSWLPAANAGDGTSEGGHIVDVTGTIGGPVQRSERSGDPGVSPKAAVETNGYFP